VLGYSITSFLLLQPTLHNQGIQFRTWFGP
jgi:hypothetical protein